MRAVGLISPLFDCEQMGVPSDKAQYVHRVGRTARAGKRGQALLMLCDFEAAFLNKVRVCVQ
jgi:ATP-dependent RNA helicase MSS116